MIASSDLDDVVLGDPILVEPGEAAWQTRASQPGVLWFPDARIGRAAFTSQAFLAAVVSGSHPALVVARGAGQRPLPTDPGTGRLCLHLSNHDPTALLSRQLVDGWKADKVAARIHDLVEACHALHIVGKAHGGVETWSIVASGDRWMLLPPAVGMARRINTDGSLRAGSLRPPEQPALGSATIAADVYACSALIALLIDGAVPAPGDDPHGRPRWPDDLAAAVAAGLAKVPAHRPALEELVKLLRRLGGMSSTVFTAHAPAMAFGDAPPAKVPTPIKPKTAVIRRNTELPADAPRGRSPGRMAKVGSVRTPGKVVALTPGQQPRPASSWRMLVLIMVGLVVLMLLVGFITNLSKARPLVSPKSAAPSVEVPVGSSTIQMPAAAPIASAPPSTPAQSPDKIPNAVGKTDLRSAKVIFLGDGLVEGWTATGKLAWNQHFAPLSACPVFKNLGSQHLLMALNKGWLNNAHPEVIVVQYRTPSPTDPAIDVDSFGAAVEKLRAVMPSGRIIIMGNLETSSGGEPKVIERSNARLAAKAKEWNISFVDPEPFNAKVRASSALLNPGQLRTSLTAKGYMELAEVLKPAVIEALGAAPR